MKAIGSMILFFTLALTVSAQSTITQSDAPKAHLSFGISSGDTTAHNIDRVFGVWSDFSANLGDHVSVNGLGQAQRIKTNFSSVPLHNLEGRGDLRFTPFSLRGFNFFGSAGVDANHISGQGGAQSFLSPTVGGGIAYGKWATAHYFHSFPDMISPISLYGDTVRGQVNVPIRTSKWGVPLGVEYRRFYAQQSAPLGGPFAASSIQFFLGLSRSF